VVPRVRQVTIEDAGQIAAIYEPVVRETAISFELEPPGPEEIARRIGSVTSGHPWLVSEEVGVVLGYAYATAFRQRPAYRWSIETTVYVHRDHRGRGVGRDLYRCLLDLSVLWGFANAYAGIALPNPASESLHTSLGFAPIGVFPRAGHKLGEWHDVGWWHRPLDHSDPPRAPAPPPEERVRALLAR
jgi:L-amino acid N-acyltransferase YncA